jgi:hypothetical protein
MGDRAEHSYTAFGLLIQSELFLPELAPPPQSFTGPEVRIGLGSVPTMLPGAETFGRFLQIANRQLVFEIPAVARYWVRNGNEILVEPFRSTEELSVRRHILKTGLTVICLQSGRLPLHASAVLMDGRAIAFLGRSGAGKSTLAAYLQKLGAVPLCDDVCAITFEEGEEPLLWPGPLELELRPAAVAITGDGLVEGRSVDDIQKIHIPFSRDVAPSVPLHRLYVLPDPETKSVTPLTRLAGLQSVRAIIEHTHRNWLIKPMGVASANYQQILSLVRKIPIFDTGRQWGADRYNYQVSRLVGHILL